MKRLIYDKKTCSFKWSDWKTSVTNDFGPSCVLKDRNIDNKIRVNNQEVSTGKNRTALYTMPGGIDNGVRYSPLYEHSGLDITEIASVKSAMESAKKEATKMISNEIEKQVEEEITKNLPKANQTDNKTSNSSGTSE